MMLHLFFHVDFFQSYYPSKYIQINFTYMQIFYLDSEIVSSQL